MLLCVMKKALKIIVLLILLGFLALLGAGIWGYFYLTSDKFKKTLVDKTSETLGVQVAVEDLQFSIFSGFQLKGVRISNPSGSKNPDFLRAESFSLSYNWRTILEKKLEINKVVLDRPVISMEQMPSGDWAFPGQVGTGGALHQDTQREADAGNVVSGTPVKSTGVPVSIEVFDIDDGKISILRNDGTVPFSLDGFSVDARVSVAGGKASLAGQLKARDLDLVTLGKLTNLSSDFAFHEGLLTLSNFRANCFGGDVAGGGTLQVSDEDHLPLQLNVIGQGLDLKPLLAQLGNRNNEQLTGKLNVKALINAPLTRPLDYSASGNMEIIGGKVTGVPMLQLIGSVFNISEFQEMNLTTAKANFNVVNKVVTISDLLFIASDIQLTGGGTITMDNQYDLKLVLMLSNRLYEKMPNDIRARLSANPDGTFTTPEFRVYGAQNNLQTDLLGKLLQRGIEGAAQDRLQKLNEKAGDLFKGLFK